MFYEIYTKLLCNLPSDCNFLFAQPLAGNNGLMLSIDTQAFPCLLFESNRYDHRTDIELRAIDIKFSRDCSIKIEDDGIKLGNYTIVSLKDNDPDIVQVFLRLLEETFYKVNYRYSNREIANKILDIANLFKHMNETVGDALGLWGELYIITKSIDINSAIQSWCLHKKAKYDFVTNQFALEVKTTLGSKRKHQFSIEQLRPNGEFDVFVASLCVVELYSGKTVFELINEIYNQISNAELRSQFFSHCLIKGGMAIYNSTLTLQSLTDKGALLFFDSINIPTPYIEPSAPIDNIRFDVDLSSLKPVSEIDFMMLL